MQIAAVALIVLASCAHDALGSNPKVAEDIVTYGFKLDDGGRRSLLQTAGSALGEVSALGSVQSSSKNQPTGDTCYISSSSTAKIDCTLEGVGTSLQQVPSCCSSTSRSSSTTCASYDNAGGFQCTNSARPYPSCCEYRNQPAAACSVGSLSQTSITCRGDRPAVACCSSPTTSSCSVDKRSITGSRTNCASSAYLACCAA